MVLVLVLLNALSFACTLPCGTSCRLILSAPSGRTRTDDLADIEFGSVALAAPWPVSSSTEPAIPSRLALEPLPPVSHSHTLALLQLPERLASCFTISLSLYDAAAAAAAQR